MVRMPLKTPFVPFCAALIAIGLEAQAAQPIYIGLDTNPPPSEGAGEAAKRKWFNKGVHAGMSTVSLSPTWNTVEKTAGKYEFGDLDFQAKLARENNLPVYLNIRIIDTNNRALPAPYATWNFDDPRLQKRLIDLIQAIGPRVRGQVKWVSIGNEVDSYFSSHGNEIPAYCRLLDGVMSTVRSSFPGALFTVNFTFAGLDQMNREMRPITDKVEFTSLTYYPMNPDFKFRDPKDVPGDFAKMFAAARGKKVFFQELGYASSDRVNSSEEKQARFMSGVLSTLAEHRGQAIAAHFVWMSDIPLSMVEMFGSYYKLPNSDKFKAFLASLGYFDRAGKAKQAWGVFEREAGALSRVEAAPAR
jgi:hypothetical protein